MNILIPCFSDAPDRDHNAVVLTVDDELLGRLAANRRAFDLRKLTDPDLYAHEYEGGPIHYLHIDDYGVRRSHGEYLDAPEGPVLMNDHLLELELLGPWQLEPAPNVSLKVVAEGFFYTWDGRREKHGPSESYETETFDLAQLEALRLSTASQPPRP